MKANSVMNLRLTWEDRDNLKFIRYYYAERNLNNTDVIRMLLRDARRMLEAEVGCDPDPSTNLADFLMRMDRAFAPCADAHINPEPAPSSDDLPVSDATNAR